MRMRLKGMEKGRMKEQKDVNRAGKKVLWMREQK